MELCDVPDSVLTLFYPILSYIYKEANAERLGTVETNDGRGVTATRGKR